MGCCASTDASHISKSESNRKRSSKSPPSTHPLQEEEAVKEVLSETPTLPKHPPPAYKENGRTETPFIKAASLLMPRPSKPLPDDKKTRNGVFRQMPSMFLGNEEASEDVSEICSTVSESVSVSTYVTERKDNYCGRENNALSKIRNSSPAKVGNQSFPGEYKREMSAGKSPYRRSEPSPGRVRTGPGRRKYSNEETPVRRSRSPMVRADSGSVKPSAGRIQTSKRTDKSSGRAGTESGEKIRKLEEEPGDHQWPMDSNELLENPLVSLECFIFL